MPHKSKLSASQVIDIYNRVWRGATHQKLATEYGVTTSAIYRIKVKENHAKLLQNID